MTDRILIDREMLERVAGMSDRSCITAIAELRAVLAAPATVQGVNAQLLEALEQILHAEMNAPISESNAGCVKRMQGIARAAIAAAQEGGKV